MHQPVKRAIPYLVVVTGVLGAVALVIVTRRDNSEPINHPLPRSVGSVEEGLREGPQKESPELIQRLLDPSLDLDEQVAAIRALPSTLSTEDVGALVDMLGSEMPERIRQDSWYVLLNEVMEVLRQPRFAWRGYGIAMRGIISDRDVDGVVRDYAAQHLSLWLGDASDAQWLSGEFVACIEVYLSVIGDDRQNVEPVVGTILMSLCDLEARRSPPEFKPFLEELHSRITGIASGEVPSSLSNRISAIQAAGRLGVLEALPTIRDLAKGSAPNPSIRLSSVAALGYYHDPTDRAFLERLAASDSGLRKAALAALRNFPDR